MEQLVLHQTCAFRQTSAASEVVALAVTAAEEVAATLAVLVAQTTSEDAATPVEWAVDRSSRASFFSLNRVSEAEMEQLPSPTTQSLNATPAALTLQRAISIVKQI
jgi:hypothetical protein